jgi:hypothetical protein
MRACKGKKLRSPPQSRSDSVVRLRGTFPNRRVCLIGFMIQGEGCDGSGHHALPAHRSYMFMGMDVDPKEFPRSPGPFARKFCPFCACDHLWHKEDARFVAIKPVSRPRIQQTSAISMGSGAAASGGRAAVNTSSGVSPDAQASQLVGARSSFSPDAFIFT